MLTEIKLLDNREVFIRSGFKGASNADFPLVVAIHGGGYSSEYLTWTNAR